MEAVPDPNVSVGIACDPYPIEMVIRGYLTGHAWREYRDGKRMLCGVVLPEGMKEHDRFPEAIITPATKAEEGHDLDISREEIIQQKLVDGDDYQKMESYTRQLFARGSEEAAKQGLILVDTKYEFGRANDQVYLIDEVHTPDSSRYFYADTYQENQDKGLPQKQLSKEFVREWLIENGFQGLEGQQVPEMNDEIVDSITDRYTELYERLTGEKFQPAIDDDPLQRIEKNVLEYFKD